MQRHVNINGDLLREHRASLGTRDYVVARSHEPGNQSFSISSLVRAEGGRVSKQVLRRIAKVLGKPSELYLLEEHQGDPHSIAFNFSGEWLGMYLEDDIEPQPYIVTENIFLSHSEQSLKGVITPNASDHPSGFLREVNFVCEAHAVSNIVHGNYYSESGFGLTGLGCFELLVTRNGEWLEGFCMFYDDVRKITVSPYIWIKMSASTFSMHTDQAKSVLAAKKAGYVAFNDLKTREPI